MRTMFFFFLHFRISRKDCKMNILSEVEYPWRKPDCFSHKTEKDSENSVNLSFSIAVKSLQATDNRRQTTDDGRQVMAIVQLDLWSR